MAKHILVCFYAPQCNIKIAPRPTSFTAEVNLRSPISGLWLTTLCTARITTFIYLFIIISG